MKHKLERYLHKPTYLYKNNYVFLLHQCNFLKNSKQQLLCSKKKLPVHDTYNFSFLQMLQTH